MFLQHQRQNSSQTLQFRVFLSECVENTGFLQCFFDSLTCLVNTSVFFTCMTSSSHSKPAQKPGICSVLTRQHAKKTIFWLNLSIFFSSCSSIIQNSSIFCSIFASAHPDSRGCWITENSKTEPKLDILFVTIFAAKKLGELVWAQKCGKLDTMFYERTMHFTCIERPGQPTCCQCLRKDMPFAPTVRADFSVRMNFHRLIHKSCTQWNQFPSFRHRHLPPPWAHQALQAPQVPQARQVQLPPAVGQVPLVLRCLEFIWWIRNEASSAVGCWRKRKQHLERLCSHFQTTLNMKCGSKSLRHGTGSEMFSTSVSDLFHSVVWIEDPSRAWPTILEPLKSQSGEVVWLYCLGSGSLDFHQRQVVCWCVYEERLDFLVMGNEHYANIYWNFELNAAWTDLEERVIVLSMDLWIHRKRESCIGHN